ncbi:hypothetical protein J5U18_09385 [Sphingobacteriaceae bacterium WQ 2009]|uniref:DUF962 domain-containing protein n=1 Tax=Rhinopithecimicrobium faecis TaxID=2820698 RepID=A0A8T4HAH5_9SPHI|nr:hypothetical protein [Sphingobacteriaceae bacterium WQ 2009]
MKKAKKGGSTPQVVAEPQRKVDELFARLSANYTDPINRRIQIIFLPLFFFGLLGVIWLIPFPQFAFLERLGWHTFLNWASFFIALVIYLYLKLSPSLSYVVLFCIGIMSYFIVSLEMAVKTGGPNLWLVFGSVLIISFIALLIGKNREPRKLAPHDFFQLLTVGPIWLWHFVIKRFKIKY